MNYLVYDERMTMLSRHNTVQEAIASGNKWKLAWKQNGCPNERHFTVHYNGNISQLQFDSKAAPHN